MPHRERVLIQALVRMADSLVEGYDPVDMAQELVEVVVDLLPIDAASVMLADHRDRLQVLATNSEETRLLELFQLQAEVGPGVSAFESAEPILIRALAEARDRWPAFTDRAHAEGWGSVYALPMRLRAQRVGVVNLFAVDRPDRLSDRDIALAQALADVATIGILHARVLADTLSVSAQLQAALNSRIVIEQAKGMLAEEARIGMDSAFNALRTYARDTNTRMVDLARAVIDRTADTTAILARNE
ncbi:ANTAR domain-containing protein [Nocardia sp. ET3-3]|uniref:ANTAR domain-containing protein n=1 Tax=Nocardia terrae TaxID=2675851 RepID=A0A7K1UUY2_9NOCA|nr:GAF and ANTAR domain-containing protein [Nocardia terrae]MVU78173.1 ANTAR domain-containing protein [Nocardia terrae]